MAGIRKFVAMAQANALPPANLWEVLERGNADTFPLHTALWLFKNAQGETGAFQYLPGPVFAYCTREPEAHSACGTNSAFTLVALAWLLCLSAYGKGHLPAGPTAAVYGNLSEGYHEPPARLPQHPGDLPEEIRDLMRKATFPLLDLPALSPRQVAYVLALRSMKYASIFGPMECQLLRRAQISNRGKFVPEEVERDLQQAVERAKRAFEMPSLQDWEYDQMFQRELIKHLRCQQSPHETLPCNDPPAPLGEHKGQRSISPYSPPYWGLPIFDLRPLLQEAMRLIKLAPEKLERQPFLPFVEPDAAPWISCQGFLPSLPFMEPEDWERCHRYKRERRLPKRQEQGTKPVRLKNADEAAAWDWLERIYGLRVRFALYPSDRSHKVRFSSPLDFSAANPSDSRPN